MRRGTRRAVRRAAWLASLWVSSSGLAEVSAQTSAEAPRAPSGGGTPTQSPDAASDPEAPPPEAPQRTPEPGDAPPPAGSDVAERPDTAPPAEAAPPPAPPSSETAPSETAPGEATPGADGTVPESVPLEAGETDLDLAAQSPPPPLSALPEDAFVLQPSRMTSEEEARLLAELRRYRGPFAQGRLRLSVLLGGGTNFQDNYLIVGAGVGYFPIDGLEASLGGTAWLLGDPFIGTVTPGLTYVFYQVPKIHPYLGAFYRHYFITSSFDDFDTYGGRGGVNLLVGDNGYVGGGVVYERLFDCQRGVWQDCDQWYPELTFAIVF